MNKNIQNLDEDKSSVQTKAGELILDSPNFLITMTE